jgi:hypothetical protein
MATSAGDSRATTLAFLAAMRNHSLSFMPASLAFPDIKIRSVSVIRTTRLLLFLTSFTGRPPFFFPGLSCCFNSGSILHCCRELNKITFCDHREQKRRVGASQWLDPGYCITITCSLNRKPILIAQIKDDRAFFRCLLPAFAWPLAARSHPYSPYKRMKRQYH